MRFSGAGVLIIEVANDGVLSLVLFHDKAKRAYADPGGKCEHVKHANDPRKTARAELSEETASLIRSAILSDGYVEKQVGKKRDNRWYRAYFLPTEKLRTADYDANVRRLCDIQAPSHLQETDRMARVKLSELYKKIMEDHPTATKKIYVKSLDGSKILLHARVVDLMREAFRGGPEWLMRLISRTPIGKYTRTRTSDGLVHYDYAR